MRSVPPSFLNEIKSRLRASDVIGRHVSLKKAGREWRGLSPFNKERTPSFYVNDEKAAFFDFSSGNHGDIFKFLMLTQNRTFPEAVEELAAMAGMEVPKATPEEHKRASEAEILIKVLGDAATFFADQLRGPDGDQARAYLRRREVSHESLEAFSLGYAPNSWEALRRFFLGRGITEEMLIRAGLLIKRDDGSTYDRFRDRLMFPIRDPRGRVIAFGGRALQKDAQAKYLNSPETEVFHKGRVLYNFGRARAALKNNQGLLVAEGYMDALALDAAGFAAVAPLGTALTEQQLSLLWRVEQAPILCFDGDRAGRAAAERALDRALPLLSAKQALRFVFLPEGQDPDDVLRKNGPQAMSAIINARADAEETMWQLAVNRHGIRSAEQTAALETELRERVAKVQDPTMRDALSRAFKDRLYRLRGEIFTQSRSQYRTRRERGAPVARPSEALRKQLGQGGVGGPNSAAREAQLVVGLIHHPKLFHLLENEVMNLKIEDSELAQLLTRVIDILVGRPDLDSEGLRAHLLSNSVADSVYQRWSEDPLVRIPRFVRRDADTEAAKTGWLDTYLIDRRHKVLSAEISEAGAEAHLDSGREQIWLKSVRQSLESSTDEETPGTDGL
ncbi:MAG: DNA primase [Parvularculaceae bacterium]|nr:DNA primase [Parvularculaceae bacterium]